MKDRLSDYYERREEALRLEIVKRIGRQWTNFVLEEYDPAIHTDEQFEQSLNDFAEIVLEWLDKVA